VDKGRSKAKLENGNSVRGSRSNCDGAGDSEQLVRKCFSRIRTMTEEEKDHTQESNGNQRSAS